MSLCFQNTKIILVSSPCLVFLLSSYWPPLFLLFALSLSLVLLCLSWPGKRLGKIEIHVLKEFDPLKFDPTSVGEKSLSYCNTDAQDHCKWAGRFSKVGRCSVDVDADVKLSRSTSRHDVKNLHFYLTILHRKKSQSNIQVWSSQMTQNLSRIFYNFWHSMLTKLQQCDNSRGRGAAPGFPPLLSRMRASFALRNIPIENT